MEEGYKGSFETDVRGENIPCVVHEFAAEKTALFDAVIVNGKRKRCGTRARDRNSEEEKGGTVGV